MTDEQMRIAIAEACGWYDFGSTAPERGSMEPRIIGRCKERMDRRIIPDYPNDLNAMHEAEKCLTMEKELFYLDELSGIIMNTAYKDDPRYLESSLCSRDLTYRATARQRAEAFLRTIGKWKEETK